MLNYLTFDRTAVVAHFIKAPARHWIMLDSRGGRAGH